MAWTKPTVDDLARAIAIYITHAYPAGPTSATRKRLETFKSASVADPAALYDSALFERDAADPPERYSFRLGNAFYPHMKLVIERAPDGLTHLFRADTHDRHISPSPTSKDYPLFKKLMVDNQALSEAIESAWALENLPTFRTYLKQDLARRRLPTN